MLGLVAKAVLGSWWGCLWVVARLTFPLSQILDAQLSAVARLSFAGPRERRLSIRRGTLTEDRLRRFVMRLPGDHVFRAYAIFYLLRCMRLPANFHLGVAKDYRGLHVHSWTTVRDARQEPGVFEVIFWKSAPAEKA